MNYEHVPISAIYTHVIYPWSLSITPDLLQLHYFNSSMEISLYHTFYMRTKQQIPVTVWKQYDGGIKICNNKSVLNSVAKSSSLLTGCSQQNVSLFVRTVITTAHRKRIPAFTFTYTHKLYTYSTQIISTSTSAKC